MQHVLPPGFQKSRSYGLHHGSSKITKDLCELLKRNGSTIRTIMEIITHLMGLEKMKCTQCGSNDFKIEKITPDKSYVYTFLFSSNSLRAPPKQSTILDHSSHIETHSGESILYGQKEKISPIVAH